MDNKKIVWLASYPKSGNTWFRAFITALLNDGEVDINGMKTDGIFSSRKLLEENTDLDSALLYNDEAKRMQGSVFNHIVNTAKQERYYIKIHDAYTYQYKQPLVPTDCTHCAIYFVRNPLDIVASLANHKEETIDEAIASMNNISEKFSDQSAGINIKNQLEQLLLDWSGHIESWTGNLPFPVLVIRYEDMLIDTYNTFIHAVKFIGLDVSDAQIQNAIAASSFDILQQKEQQQGFTEKMRKTIFFRKGVADGWKEELTQEQAKDIIKHHSQVMSKFGYM